MISIGGIIGAGLFVGSSVAIAATGPAAVLSYLLTGVLVLLVMRMLGEMAVALPMTSSFTEFARVGLGPWAGFVCGWLYWYFWIIVVPVEAIAGANILHQWLPLLPAWQLGLGLMAVMTAVNLMSARSYAEFEFWFASIKVAAIIVFIALAASFVFGLSGHPPLGFGNLSSYGGFMPYGAIAVFAGVTTVFFSLAGAEIVTIAAAESSEPAQAVARLTSSVVWRILIFYVGSILLIVTVIPWNTIIPGHSPFTSALVAMHVPFTSTIMSLIILTAVLSCLNSCFYVTSRVLFALAKQGDAPAWLVKTSANHVPRRSVMLGSVAGVAGVLAELFSPNGVFAFLINASGALFLFIYIAIAAAQIRLRYARQAAGKPQPQLKMWLFPWTSYLAIGAMIGVLTAMGMTPELSQELWVSLLTVAVALIAFALLRGWRHARTGG
jgi:AAT family amino acid transporter/GABA permease